MFDLVELPPSTPPASDHAGASLSLPAISVSGPDGDEFRFAQGTSQVPFGQQVLRAEIPGPCRLLALRAQVRATHAAVLDEILVSAEFVLGMRLAEEPTEPVIFMQGNRRLVPAPVFAAPLRAFCGKNLAALRDYPLLPAGVVEVGLAWPRLSGDVALRLELWVETAERTSLTAVAAALV